MLSARSQDPNFLWFRWFLVHEALFFLPCFILGIRGLLKGISSLSFLDLTLQLVSAKAVIKPDVIHPSDLPPPKKKITGSPSVYPLLLAYAAAASTTTATCLVVLVLGDHKVPLTPTQFMFLLSAYGECFNDWLPELY
jgi:hypothetical protein